MSPLSLVGSSPSVLADRLDGEVLSGLEVTLQRLTASSEGWQALLAQVYDPQAAGSQEQFRDRAELIRQAIADGSFSIALELRSAEELQGGLAAYAADAPGGGERIYLNADWAAVASAPELERALLEELGHAFDQRLNSGVDTAGDEGALFAARALGDVLDPATFASISTEDDSGVVQIDGQSVPVEFYNPATANTDGDQFVDAIDVDDDNDGILDTVEAKASAVAWKPTRDDFSYAQNTAGGNTTHNAAGLFLTGDRNDPFNFFDGIDSTELRVHALDVYEFRLPTGGVNAGSSFTLREGAASNSNDGITMVLASLDTTDPSGNLNNATGGGLGWKTISAAFGGVSTPSALGALYTGTPVTSADGKFTLLYYGKSDKDQTLTTPIDVKYLQIVGIETHGGWGDISVGSVVDLSLDTDQDGIPNSRDLDSDNDGISDLYESVGSATSASVVRADLDRSGTISRNEAISYLTASGGWLDPATTNPDFNGNGLWDFLDSSGATAANVPVDSDGDGVADLLDLDSDNDGIPDTVEARPSANYRGNDFALDPSGVRNNDADGDGVINLFDTNDATTGAFGGTFGTPVNTDGVVEGSTPSFPASGKPVNATVDVSVDNIKIGDIKSILNQDNAYAKLNSSGDVLVLDMGRVLNAGDTVLIRAQVRGDVNGTMRVSQGDATGSGGTTGSPTTFTFAQKDTYQLIEYTVQATGSRYIKFQTGGSNKEIRIDTVSWGSGIQGVAQPNPDYLDNDSDEDGFVDKSESGQFLSGVDANGDGIDDAVAASYADPDGNVWNGASDPSGLQLGLKNTDSTPSEYDYRSTPTANDLFVSDNVTVNEASPYANFTITGTAGKVLFLSLKTLGAGPGYATDTAGATASNPADYGPTIQVLVGGSWVDYTDASGVTLDASGSALARVSIINDLASIVYEGPEVYQLEARDASGVTSSGGIGVIVDDGTGDVFLSGNLTDAPDLPDASGIFIDGEDSFALDDDRVVQINNLRVNEGSSYAVFKLTGTTAQFTLSLEGGTATLWDGTGGATNDPSGLKDFGRTLEYLDASGVWQLYDPFGAPLTLPESGELLVRTPINQDLLLETDGSGNGETFRLKATRVDGLDSSGGLAEIFDNGSGSIYPGTVDASGNLIVDPSGASYDDDAPININNVTVNEASQWAVFDLEGGSNLGFKLSLLPGNQTGQLDPSGANNAAQGSDYGAIAQIEILNDSGVWVPYNDASGAFLDGNGEREVRVRIFNDNPAVYEGLELYTLRATTLAGVISSGGLGGIIDDGTGLIFNDAGEIDEAAEKDDDRSLTVDGGVYNEGSKWAVFQVQGAPGQEVFLDLSGNSATEWNGSGPEPSDPSGLKDFGPNLQVQDASGNWNAYTPGTAVFLDASGNINVRTRLYNDPLFETIAPNDSGETFELIATSSGGVRSSGTATILDNGQGELLDLSGNPDPGPKDNDLPGLTVAGPPSPVSEGSTLVFTVTLETALPSNTLISLRLSDISTEPGDYQTNLSTVGEVFYFDASGQEVTLQSAGPDQFVLPAGVSKLYVRVPSIQDDIYEGEEELALTAALVDFPGTDASGSGFITDDGTGTVYDGSVDPSGGDLGIDGTKTPDNDIPTLTVTTVTPSISEGSVGFFSITLDKPLETAASLSLSLFGGPGTPEADDSDRLFSSGGLQVSWFEGANLITRNITLLDAYNGSILYPAGIQELFVRVQTVSDDVYEGAENFTLSASLDLGLAGPSVGLLALEEVTTLAELSALPQLTGESSANIVDDGTGVPYSGSLDASGNPLFSGTSDNDIPSLAVTSLIPEISEGNSGLFKIELGKPLAFEAALNLQLRPGTAEADDYTGPVPSRVFYLDPGNGTRVFLSVDGSGNVVVPVGITTLFAVVETTPDDRYEGDETFFLDARLNLPDVADPSGSASALISDDGSAPVYKEDASGNPLLDGGLPELDPSGVPDDDRPSRLTIQGPGTNVSEGSPVVFKVSLDAVSDLPLPIALNLTDISTEPGDYSPLQQGEVFYLDGTNEVNLLKDGSGNYVIPAGVQVFYVRFDSTQDSVYEGLEQLRLNGSLVSVPGVDGSGVAGIIDDGTGTVYTSEIDPSGNPAFDPSGVRDDDRGGLTVETLTPDVSEGSTAVFEVRLSNALVAPTLLKLELSPISPTATADDYDFAAAPQVYYYDASGQRQFLEIDESGNVLLPALVTKLYVKVDTTSDDVYEGPERFKLTASMTLASKLISAEDEATILDDGTGTTYTGDIDPSGNPLIDDNRQPDNDIPSLAVTSLIPEISEGNSGLFKIELGKPLAFEAALNLQLRPGTAEADDYTGPVPSRVFYLDPGNGTRVFLSVDGSGNVVVPVGISTLFAVVETTPDDRYEGDETFFLDARLNLPGLTDPSGSATALISDDGSAPVYREDASGNPLLDGGLPELDPSGVPDDDRPTRLTIQAPGTNVSEGSPVVFKVSLDAVSDLPLAVALNLSDISTEPGDYNPVLNPFDVFYTDQLGNPQLLLKDGSGNYLIPPGVQDFYVIVRTNDDDVYEGLEQFRLSGSLVTLPGVDGSGVAGIIDDGTGTVYTGELDPSGNPAVDPSGVRDDDRGGLIVTTRTPDVSEGSTALFEIKLGSVLADPTPMRLELIGITAEANDMAFDPNGLQVIYRDASGNPVAVSLDSSGTFIVPAGITSFLVKVNTIQDDVYEGLETFQLKASLLGAGNPTDSDDANILDNGTGKPYTGALDSSGNPVVGPGPADNDIPGFGITSLIPEISEGQSGLFRIDLTKPLELAAPIQLGLRNGTAETDDYGFPAQSQVFYLDPSGERVYLSVDPSSGIVNLPPMVTTLYVVVDTTPDDVFEGPESFFLDALLDLPATGADPSGSAGALIADDGSAPVYVTDPSGNLQLDASGAPFVDVSGVPDDDRTLRIIGGVYNEASPYLFWTVKGNAGQPLRQVSLIGDPSGADPAVDLSGDLQYRDASGIWQSFTDAINPVLDASGELLVRKAVVNDDSPEGLENFSLTLEYPSGPRATGVSSLIDDSTGLIPTLDPSGNPTLDGSGIPQDDPSKVRDDDRVLAVASTIYNEASPYLFWEVTGARGQIARFVGLTGDPSGADPFVDLSGNLQYRDASGIWQTLDASSNPVLDASGSLLIRKAVVNDRRPEGLENFTLSVENTGGKEASGIGGLVDDGSGLIPNLDPSGNPTGFDASGNPAARPNAIKDDDRRLAVTGSTVNEASLFTFFKVDGAPGQLVTLSLNPGTAEPGSDYTNKIEFSSDAGKTWTLYTPESGLVPLNASGTLLVRVPILNDLPPVDEPDETFELRATNTGGKAGIGTATIVDDGNGTIYKPDGTPDPSGVPDNDKLPARLVSTDDGQGLKVIGQAGKSLWVDLSVVMSDASLQNGFDLIKVNAQGQRSRIGAIGATPNSGFFGDNRYQFVVGEELRFVQVSSDLPANSRPDLEISGTDNCVIVGLDDDGGDGDADDLVLKVKTSETDPYPRSSQLARFQQGSELSYLDLSWIGSGGITLNLEVQTDAADLNTIGLVKVDTDASGNPLGTVDGVAPSAGAAFDLAVRANLLSYRYSQSGVQTLTAPSLTLTAAQAGVYAPVLLTADGPIYTFGAISSSDRRQHVKVLGASSFGFEDAPGGQADWDYNDTVASFSIADPATPRLELSSNGQGLTVVGGTGPADGLWLDLNAVLAEAGNQNSLDLFVRDASGVSTQVGSVGATSRGTFLGEKELFLAVGETLTFVQNTKDNAPIASPSLLITQIGDRYRVALDDEAATGGDGDYNDFVLDVDRTPLEPCEEVVKLASLQTTSSAGLLDLSTIGAEGLKLNLAVRTASGNTNTLSFVKLDSGSSNGQYSVDGVEAGNTEAFRQAVRDNLIDFRVSAGGKGDAEPKVWQLVAADEGIYAAVLLTPDNEVFTFGDDTAADGRQHLKVFGDSSFGFEDLLAGQGGDFDYNDFTVRITPV